jgi:cysteine desulfurase/selenocysteine lyase
MIEARAINATAVRADFPILGRTINGKPLVYLDSAATSQKPAVVIDIMDDYYRRYNANPHRGVYTISEEATAAYESARQRVASFINAASVKEVIFTRNTTEAINLVRYTWGRANIRNGDRILLTEMEHHSNLVPWQLLAQEVGATLEFLRIDDQGMLQLDELEARLERVRLLAITHQSNTLGTINPIKAITAAAHRAGALVLIDGAQAVPHMPVDVKDLDVDFYAFSGHKMCGPTGIGVLWARRALLEAMPPFLGGGDMIKLERPSLEVRGRYAQRGGRHRPGCGGRLPHESRDGPGSNPRADARRLRAREAAGHSRHRHLRPARPGDPRGRDLVHDPRHPSP